MALAIKLHEVTISRQSEHGRLEPVLADLSLSIAAGERVALVGKNGAGKTSLLLALVGALEFEGEILIGEARLEARSLDAIRRELGFVFADPADQLFCASVAEEVAFGLHQRGHSPERAQERVHGALAEVGLLGLEGRAPARISLGEQRRLAIAAALVTRPGAILIDEPTAALDPVARRVLLSSIGALDATVVIATHDLDAALDLDARSVVLDRGKIAADGPAQKILLDRGLLERAGLELPLSVRARGT
jgi:cobalt/nickel transport system ATP-binding protein